MKRLPPILLLAVLMAAVAAGCGGSSGPKSVPTGDIAVVGDQTISKQQMNDLLVQVKASYKAQKRAFPKKGSTAYKTLQDQIIQYLIQVDEFEQKAKSVGVQVTAKDIDQRLKQVKTQYFGGSDAKYRQALKSQGLTEQAYRDSLRAQLTSEKLFNKVTGSATVSAAAVQQYYNSHGQYEKRSVRHILVNSKSLADKLYTQLQNGADFAKLAKQYSKDPGSKAQGGKLEISKGQTVPAFDKVAFSLKTGATSKPVHTQFGWHIIRADGPIQKTPFSQVKASIRQQLLQTKKNDAMTQYVNDMKKSYCDNKIAYQVGYAPATDPCTALTVSTPTTTAPTTTQ